MELLCCLTIISIMAAMYISVIADAYKHIKHMLGN